MSDRPKLRALAERLGIEDGYRSALDQRRVETTDGTREALCAAMGHAASTEAEAGRELAALDRSAAERWIEPVVVVEVGSSEADALRLGAGASDAPASWRLRVEAEDGRVAEVEGRGSDVATIPLPFPLVPGEHQLRIQVDSGGGSRREHQRRIVAPAHCWDLEDFPRRDVEGSFGLWANLYSVRSDRNWGFGDFGDLEALVAWAAREGATFVGLNPLHALANRPGQVSPYSPLTRLYRNELYLSVESIPELAHCPEAQAWIQSPEAQAARAALRDADRLDPQAVQRQKRTVLRALYACFRESGRRAQSARAEEFQRFQDVQGSALADFATFVALAEHLEATRVAPPGALDWRSWPEPYRDCQSADVRRFREQRADEVGFHAWLQFELDRQLAAAGQRSAQSGLALGLYTDLALGSAPEGFDAWRWPGLFARTASAGAPPDAFSVRGQDWSFPPLQPVALRATAYDYWRRILQAAFAHAGALRIDHILGLRRLWWIPEGASPECGAYVSYPEQELLSILALESQRARALVIGEDLGTVPPGFSEEIQARSILSSRVLLFEHDGERFRRPEDYPRRALVTVNTHDLPPLAAFAGDSDLALRRTAGQIPDDAALERSRAERRADREALRAGLAAEGFSDPAAPDEPRPAAAGRDPVAVPAARDASREVARWNAAVAGFLARTPCALLGLALDDLAAEAEPINLPGVPPERHASWTRRMSSELERLEHHPVARAALDAAARRQHGPGGGGAISRPPGSARRGA